MCEGHGADPKLVKHPQNCKAAVNRVTPLYTYQTGYFLFHHRIGQVCRDKERTTKHTNIGTGKGSHLNHRTVLELLWHSITRVQHPSQVTGIKETNKPQRKKRNFLFIIKNLLYRRRSWPVPSPGPYCTCVWPNLFVPASASQHLSPGPHTEHRPQTSDKATRASNNRDKGD